MKHHIAILTALLAISTAARADYGDITLCGQLLPPNATEITDVWGYIDQSDNREYAIVGSWTAGIYIIDVTDPYNPSLRNQVTPSNVYGFDVKVWSHYVYTCSGSYSGTTSRVIDISDLDNPVVSTGFAATHNFSVSPDGYLYAELLGLKCYDIHTAPMTPALKWTQGNADAHDSYPVGDRLYDFRGGFSTYIWDISNRNSPTLLADIDHPNIVYHHSGTPDKTGNYLYICDEKATDPAADVTVWNISNLAFPSMVNGIWDPNATIHNLYTVGDLAFASYYSAGFRVYDVATPYAPILLDTYDTAPSWTGENWEGCFGVYPFSPSGKIFVTDFDNGLFIFSIEGHTPSAVADDGAAPPVGTLAQNFPNPFNPVTTIRYRLVDAGHVTLDVFNARGTAVTTLVEGHEPSGEHEVSWDGTDAGGASVASGVYYYRLVIDGRSLTKQMVLLK